MCNVCDDGICDKCGENGAGASGLCSECKRASRTSRKPTKHERKLMVQRRKVNRRLGGNARGFFAAAG